MASRIRSALTSVTLPQTPDRSRSSPRAGPAQVQPATRRSRPGPRCDGEQDHAHPAPSSSRVLTVAEAQDIDIAVPEAADEVRRIAVKLAALAQAGLTYGQVSYDLDRYRQITDLASRLLAAVSERSAEELTLELGRDVGYTTPKVDVRGVLFDSDERVLLMRERIDGHWSAPGGWADPGDAPSVAAIREVREETGYPAEAVKLIGCWDRDLQGHLPRMHVSIYKLFFLCRQVGEPAPPDALETLEIGWFGLDELPPLSAGRINEWQLRRALAHHRDPSLPTEFD